MPHMKQTFLSFLHSLDSAENHSLIESIASAYTLTHPIMEMKDVSSWGNGMEQGKRIGKSAKNIEKAKYKAAHPVKVRFHRTKSDYADSIAKNGLLRKNDNYGQNTGDSDEYDNVIWTADNPDRIPVLRRFGDHPRYDDDIATFKITMPKDEYTNSDRMTFDTGHRSGKMVPVKKGENSLANEGHYKIDVFNRDIPAKNLQLMSKKGRTAADAEESKRFENWRMGGNISSPGDASYYNISKQLPKNLRQDAVRTSGGFGYDGNDFSRNKYLMDNISKYIKASPNKFDWDKYNKLISEGRTPEYAARNSVIRGNSTRPWNDTEDGSTHSSMNMASGHISAGDGWENNRLNRMNSNAACASDKNYKTIKYRLLNDADSILHKLYHDLDRCETHNAYKVTFEDVVDMLSDRLDAAGFDDVKGLNARRHIVAEEWGRKEDGKLNGDSPSSLLSKYMNQLYADVKEMNPNVSDRIMRAAFKYFTNLERNEVFERCGVKIDK